MKNIMFDLYGTLVDIHTNENTNQFWNKMAQVYHWESGKKLRSFYYKSVTEKEKKIEEIELRDVFAEITKKEDDFDENIRLFRKYSTTYIKLFPGVKRLIANLKKEGYKIFLLSNAQNCFTVNEIKKLGIYDCFDGIAISSDYGCKKPNLKFYQMAMADFKIKPEETVMIGNDLICDYMAALNAGCKAILLKTKQSPNFEVDFALKGFDHSQIERKIKALA